MRKLSIIIIGYSLDRRSPVGQRLSSFMQELGYGHDCTWVGSRQWLSTLKALIVRRPDVVVISMPPFRGWLLSWVLGKKVVLDWRDGWSIAIDDGYGGLSASRPYVAKIARIIEKYSARRACLTLVCTPGLLRYHQSLIHREARFAMIPNGHTVNIRGKLFGRDQLQKPRGVIRAVCIGKFAEYGPRKAEDVLEVLAKRYEHARLEVELIGCEYRLNSSVLELGKSKSNILIKYRDAIPNAEVESELAHADLGLLVIRNSAYDLGTKAFDYVANGVPILDVFDEASQFKQYFKGCFDTDYNSAIARRVAYDHQRSVLAKKAKVLIEQRASASQ